MDLPEDNDTCILVLPLLRSFNDPPFEAIGGAVEYVRQMLELRGLVESFNGRLMQMTGLAIHASMPCGASVRGYIECLTT